MTGRLDFGPAPQRARAPRPAPAVAQPLPLAERPASWRAPTAGEHVCESCAGAACYGQGRSWFCRPCAPAGFTAGSRGEALA